MAALPARPARRHRPASGRARTAAAVLLLLAPLAAPAGAWEFFSRRFMAEEGIPVYEGYAVADVDALELAPWPRLGAAGAYIRLLGHEGLANAYVLEIAPGAQTLPEQHLFEEYLYVLSGRGETTIQQAGRDAQVVAWRAGSLLTPPLNTVHGHRNTGDVPAKLVGFTNAPPVLDLYRDADFVFHDPRAFRERYDGEADYFTRRSEGADDARLAVNFVEDVRQLEDALHFWKKKHAHVATLAMAGNALSPHLNAWDPGSYQAAHRHGAGANVLILEGTGFALMWPREAGKRPWAEGHGDRVVKVDFQPGTLFVPPRDWYHTHVNTGTDRALYLAFTGQGRSHRVQATATVLQTDPELRRAVAGLPLEASHPAFIGLGDEDPHIQELLDEAVRRRDARPAAD